jgi:hypothetical protein
MIRDDTRGSCGGRAAVGTHGKLAGGGRRLRLCRYCFARRLLHEVRAPQGSTERFLIIRGLVGIYWGRLLLSAPWGMCIPNDTYKQGR